MVNGGTNTAVQLSVSAGVPIRKNLYFQDDVEWVENWLKEHELDYPYEEINWHEIHHPNDPRLFEFE
ncbi:hypothetical protein D3C78_1792730 [compost metagenome]